MVSPVGARVKATSRAGLRYEGNITGRDRGGIAGAGPIARRKQRSPRNESPAIRRESIYRVDRALGQYTEWSAPSIHDMTMMKDIWADEADETARRPGRNRRGRRPSLREFQLRKDRVPSSTPRLERSPDVSMPTPASTRHRAPQKFCGQQRPRMSSRHWPPPAIESGRSSSRRSRATTGTSALALDKARHFLLEFAARIIQVIRYSTAAKQLRAIGRKEVARCWPWPPDGFIDIGGLAVGRHRAMWFRQTRLAQAR